MSTPTTPALVSRLGGHKPTDGVGAKAYATEFFQVMDMAKCGCLRPGCLISLISVVTFLLDDGITWHNNMFGMTPLILLAAKDSWNTGHIMTHQHRLRASPSNPFFFLALGLNQLSPPRRWPRWPRRLRSWCCGPGGVPTCCGSLWINCGSSFRKTEPFLGHVGH